MSGPHGFSADSEVIKGPISLAGGLDSNGPRFELAGE
jgi:hypothetical protein